MLVVVVVIIVWRSRSAGVVDKGWWGACLCHYVVGALARMCQLMGKVNAQLSGKEGFGCLCSGSGAPWELVCRSGSCSPWQVHSGKCASETLYPYVRCASVALRELYIRLGGSLGGKM
jgi:hypothetical protein